MNATLKSIAMYFPFLRPHLKRVEELERLATERHRFAQDLELLSAQLESILSLIAADPSVAWAEAKRRKQDLADKVRSEGSTAVLVPPMRSSLELDVAGSVTEWVRGQVDVEPYWFQKIEVLPGLHSPGWSDPVTEKLPYYGLPEDLTGKRVLDIGCAEGFFSFEAERRGAREVIGIDSFPDSIRRFNITKAARRLNASAFLMNVYDLEPKRLGTFDLVLFYGVFYHLKHPQYALERIHSVCTGDLLFQTHIEDDPNVKGFPWARFYPHGAMAGKNQELFDATVFWKYNSACCLAMLDHVGFTKLQIISTDPRPFVIRGSSSEVKPGIPPDQTTAPWC